MSKPERDRQPKTLVVVADDFGKSSSINRAIAEAHHNGIVTAASIMAGGDAFEEAVRIARESPHLSAGLHITLCDGNAVLPGREIPGLTDESGRFQKSPSLAWIRCSRRAVLSQLDREIGAQFDRLEKAGIRATHVDSHHHLHMHPAIFPLVCRHARKRGVRWVRLTLEPFSLVVCAGRRGVMPLIERLVFGALGRPHRETARQERLFFADAAYGLAQTGRIVEAYLLDLLERLNGVSELFVHPDSATHEGRRETEALMSGRVRVRAAAAGIALCGYRDIHPPGNRESLHQGLSSEAREHNPA